MNHKVSHGITGYHTESQWIIRYHTVSEGITQHHNESQGITQYHKASQGITLYHRVSHCITMNHTRYHTVSQDITRFHAVSHSITMNHKVSHGISRHHKISHASDAWFNCRQKVPLYTPDANGVHPENLCRVVRHAFQYRHPIYDQTAAILPSPFKTWPDLNENSLSLFKTSYTKRNLWRAYVGAAIYTNDKVVFSKKIHS